MDNIKPKIHLLPDRFSWVNQGRWTEQHDPFGPLLETKDERVFDMPNIYYLKGQITGQGNINRNDVAQIEVLLSQAGVFLSKNPPANGLLWASLRAKTEKKSKKWGEIATRFWQT